MQSTYQYPRVFLINILEYFLSISSNISYQYPRVFLIENLIDDISMYLNEIINLPDAMIGRLWISVGIVVLILVNRFKMCKKELYMLGW
jgi:hypothetical protein